MSYAIKNVFNPFCFDNSKLWENGLMRLRVLSTTLLIVSSWTFAVGQGAIPNLPPAVNQFMGKVKGITPSGNVIIEADYLKVHEVILYGVIGLDVNEFKPWAAGNLQGKEVSLYVYRWKSGKVYGDIFIIEKIRPGSWLSHRVSAKIIEGGMARWDRVAAPRDEWLASIKPKLHALRGTKIKGEQK